MTQLLAADLDWSQLYDLSQQSHHTTWIIAEYPDEYIFDYSQSHELKTNVSQVRWFGPTGELRARRINQIYRTVFLGHWEHNLTTLSDYSHELDTLNPFEQGYYLWGERTDQEAEWIDGSIPRKLIYPVTTQIDRSHAKLIVEIWQDHTGQTHFHRFKDLQEEAIHA